MNHKVHNQIVNFIWGIADDVLPKPTNENVLAD